MQGVKDGRLVGIEEMNISLASTIAMQMFTAFLSRQYETVSALLSTGINKGHGSGVVSSLLSLCLELSRKDLDRRKKGNEIIIGRDG